jgi:simple sugar transport system permease protein
LIWLLEASIRAFQHAVPLGLASLGETLVERSGLVNLGVEGMMAIGAAVAALVALETGSPWAGLAAGALAGLALSALYYALVVRMGADQIVVGLATVFLGIGLAEVVGAYIYGPAPPLPTVHGLSLVDPLYPLTALVLYVLVFRTWLGYSIRSVGEDPEAARALGVRVELVRAATVALGGLLAGLAGAYMVLTLRQGKWFSGVTMGWGWIAIGTVILGYWHPILVALASYLVGALFVIEPILVDYGVPVALAHATPYAAVVVTLAIVAQAARRRGIRPPTQVWLEVLG